MPSPRAIPSLFARAPSEFWWQTAFASATGLLLVLSFEPFAYSFLAWFALAPMLYVVTGGVRWKRALWLGWIAGVTFFFFSTNWISHSMIQFGGMPKVPAYGASLVFSAIAALFPSLFAFTIAKLVRSYAARMLMLAPLFWAATEWLRGAFTCATWNALGITQVSNYIFVAWIAKYGGSYLISTAVMTGSVLLVLWARQISSLRKAVFQLLPLCLVASLVIFTTVGMSLRNIFVKLSGYSQPDTVPLSSRGFMKPVTINTAVIQPYIPVNLYESPTEAPQYFDNTLKLTRDAVSQAKDKPADLIVWAESPLPLNYEQDQSVRSRLDSLAQEMNSYLIFSAIAHDGDQYFNSAQTIAPPSGDQPAAQLRRYDKIRLVPFGEYVPFRFALGYFVPPMVGDFTPGREAVVNTLRLRTRFAEVQNGAETAGQPALERTTNLVRTGTFICYEAAYPNLVRQFVRNGATLLVNISNDAWFGNTAGARQHLAHARMRAIENDRDLIRVTNSGISALITADGCVV